MVVTNVTWVVAITGLLLMGLLMAAQLIAVLRPRATWTVENIYGGSPGSADPVAYFAFNQGMAWADTIFWGPLQLIGSVGMVMGQRWGFLLALIASVPFWYSAILMFIWDRDLGFRKRTLTYWVVWGMWPLFGLVEGAYCFLRLLGT